jgi:N-methylhydantoinase B/oxoprolinase/acetone carboxylase alpha subunit
VERAEINVSAVFERMKVRPWGLFGGGHASNSAILIKKKGDDTFRTFSEVYGSVSPSKFVNCVVEPSDQVLIQSPGGGGFGEITSRDIEKVLYDVEQGFISERAAREVYKVAVERPNGRYVVNEQETATLKTA